MDVQPKSQPVLSAAANPLVYAPRPCHAFGIAVDRQQTYKLYVILSGRFTLDDCPPAAVFRSLVLQAFDGWHAAEDHPAGFAILHLAQDGTYLLACRWNNANNLRHRVFRLDPQTLQADGPPNGAPERPQLQALGDPRIIACIWELRLIKREVDAWIAAVLSQGQPVLTARMIADYAALQFTGDL